MVMKEDYCDYKLSLALKTAGFDEPCGKSVKIIPGTEREEWDEEECQWCRIQDIEYYPKISLWQAQKWLREKKGIVVIAEPDWDSEDYCMADYLTGEWYFSVWKDGDRVHCNFDPNAEEERIWMFEKYEQALSAGISAALELIKKGE